MTVRALSGYIVLIKYTNSARGGSVSRKLLLNNLYEIGSIIKLSAAENTA